MAPRRVWSISIYCRHRGAVLLVRHNRLGAWLPVGGEMEPSETPYEAARRELREETGLDHGVVFPAVHKVTGAPPGLLLYEEHESDNKRHMNFAFIAEVPSRHLKTCDEYSGTLWISSMAEAPDDGPVHVREALPYALTAGREGIIAS